jgi:hypothetical protein
MKGKMTDENEHDACVEAWMRAAAGGGASSEELVRAFDQAFGAMWRRAQLTLGDVTLTAIVDRVLYNAIERFPHLAPLSLEAGGIRCEELLRGAAAVPRQELAAGIRFVLLEFLTVLGNLTAEVLTPALHTALSRATPGAESIVEGAPAGPPRGDGEGTES